MPFDFLDVNLPQFSFPFVDAIKVTSYVNFEFETDFISELARQTALPLNNFTNDLIQYLNITTTDLDFSQTIPSNIDVNLDPSETDVEVDGNEVSNTEFKQLVLKELASDSIVSDPKLDGIRSIWNDAVHRTFSKEDKLIEELTDANSEKFEIVKDILNTEIIQNRVQKERVKEIFENDNIQVSALNTKTDIDFYNERLSGSHQRFKDATQALLSYNGEETKEIIDE
jgi:hypothetical protein